MKPSVYWEVLIEEAGFGLIRTPIILREKSVWVSVESQGFPGNRFQTLSAARARANAEWARLNPYWIVWFFGNKWQRCVRRIWKTYNQRGFR